MGDVDDDDGGGGFTRVPVEVGEVAEAAGEVVVAVEDCAEDLSGLGWLGLVLSFRRGGGRGRTTRTPRLNIPTSRIFLWGESISSMA